MAANDAFSLQKISKKSWSSEEDSKLLILIDELGAQGSWSVISIKFGNRSGKQCRERYHNHLKPDITKKTFTKEEDDLVNELQRTMGNQWAKISKYFNGRSDNAVKNRWHIINRGKPHITPPVGGNILKVIPPTTTPRNAPMIITPPSVGPFVRHGPAVPKLNLNVLSVSPTSICTSTSSKSTSSSSSCSSSTDTTPMFHHMHSSFSFGSRSTDCERDASPHSTDLQDLYYSHDGHDHHEEVCDSSRSPVSSHYSKHRHTVSTDEALLDSEDSWIDDLLKSHTHPAQHGASRHHHGTDDPLHILKVEHCSDDDWSCDGDNDGPLSYSKDRLRSLLCQNVFAEDSIVSPAADREDDCDYFSPNGRFYKTNPHTVSRPYDTFSEGALSARSASGGEEEGHLVCYDDSLLLTQNMLNRSRHSTRDQQDDEEEGDESDDLFLLFDDNMSLCDSAKPSPFGRVGGYSGLSTNTFDLTNAVHSTRCSPANPNVKRHRGVQPGGSPFGRNQVQVATLLNVI